MKLSYSHEVNAFLGSVTLMMKNQTFLVFEWVLAPCEVKTVILNEIEWAYVEEMDCADEEETYVEENEHVWVEVSAVVRSVNASG